MELIKAFLAGIAKAFQPKPPLPAPVGNAPTAGPPVDEHPIVFVGEVVKANWGQTSGDPSPQPWVSGWYFHGKQTPAHAGRIGGVIVPKAVVVHTTDMLPSAHDALVRSWTSQPGAGNAAHFLIGRTADQGVKQFCQITRNSNHAGGSTGHGWYKTGTGALIHPNTVAIGIELDCAGKLVMRGGTWRHPETNRIIPAAEVYEGPRGTGWHWVTDYQLFELSELLRALKPCLASLPQGTRVAPHGEYAANGAAWAGMAGVSPVGHVTLDPYNKTDPGPQVMAWLKENAP